jgi:hypothetical protein
LRDLRRLLAVTVQPPPPTSLIALDAPADLLREVIVGTVHELVARLNVHATVVQPSRGDVLAATDAFAALEEHLRLLLFHDAVTQPIGEPPT